MSHVTKARAKPQALPARKLHAARHTCATLMHLQGVPGAVIAAWLGHKDALLIMKLYAHTQDDALKTARATWIEL